MQGPFILLFNEEEEEKRSPAVEDDDDTEYNEGWTHVEVNGMSRMDTFQ